jgi:GcrA cell cycle regulator
MEWSDETIGRLKLLWTEGLSTAEIGRRMGISKNAVVGKAHRLLLESRPSPIRRDSASGRPPRAASPRRVVGPTLPSMAAEARAEPAMPAAPNAHSAPAPAAEPVPALRPVPLLPRADGAERRRRLACCWPIGEPGTRSFRFCDADSLHGKPYCPTHAALAYVKVRDRREDAA